MMQVTRSILRVLVLTILSTALASAAHAGYWSVVYDLAGSGTATSNLGGNYTDPVTGSFTVEYDATSSVAPLSGGRLVAGQIDGTLNQSAGILTITGANANTLLPGAGGAAGALVGDQLQLSVVTDHNLTGFIHCTDATGGTAGVCNAILMTPASVNVPQNTSGPFALPPFTFTGGTAAVGNFIAGPVTDQPTATVTIVTNYMGSEISRTWVASSVPLVGTGGIIVILGGMLATGLGVARRMTA